MRDKAELQWLLSGGGGGGRISCYPEHGLVISNLALSCGPRNNMHKENHSLELNALEKRFTFSFLWNWTVRLWALGLSFHDDDLESSVEYRYK